MFNNSKTDINTWWNHFNGVSKQQKIKTKTVLLAEGKISDKLYFIKEGCFRISLNNDEKEITFQFYLEGQLISSFDRL